MIYYDVFVGGHDEPRAQLGSVEIVYWTGVQNCTEIDEQIMAQFMGLV